MTGSGRRLVHLFVEPGHQGTGIGRQLRTLGEEAIVAAGHRELELHARVDNLSAIAFHERMGWTVTGHVIRTVEHGIAEDEQVLVKPSRDGPTDQSIAYGRFSTGCASALVSGIAVA